MWCAVPPKRQACSYGNGNLVQPCGVDKAGEILTLLISLISHCGSKSPRNIGGITESWLPGSHLCLCPFMALDVKLKKIVHEELRVLIRPLLVLE